MGRRWNNLRKRRSEEGWGQSPSYAGVVSETHNILKWLGCGCKFISMKQLAISVLGLRLPRHEPDDGAVKSKEVKSSPQTQSMEMNVDVDLSDLKSTYNEIRFITNPSHAWATS